MTYISPKCLQPSQLFGSIHIRLLNGSICMSQLAGSNAENEG